MNTDHDFIHVISQSGGAKERPSPYQSATLYKVGTKKTGLDGNIWSVTENKNGVKRWKIFKRKNYAKTKIKKAKKAKSKSKSKKMSVLDFYDVKQISDKAFAKVVKNSSKKVKSAINKLQKLVEELRKLGKTAHIIPLPLSDGGLYWSDYAGDYLDSIYGKDSEWYNNNMYFTVYMDHSGETITDRDIGANYTELNKEQKVKVINLLDKHIGNEYYKWSGSNTEKIFVLFNKSKPNVLNADTLKDDDRYPMLYISIDFDKKINLFEKDSNFILPTIDKIKSTINSDILSDHEYGMGDIILFIYSVSEKQYKKSVKKIEKQLDKMKSDKIVKSYSIDYTKKE